MRIIISLLVLSMLAAAAGAAWQEHASRLGRQTISPPGDLIDIGDGRRIHMIVDGREHHHAPTIVLETGISSFSAQWGWILPQLAETHTVVAYDRPGYGWSDPDPAGVDPDRIVDDLRTALHAHGLRGPFVLVGHSLGGFYVRTFADRFPDEVAGLVLLDASNVSPITSGPGRGTGELIRIAARLGLVRATNALTGMVDGLPEPSAQQARVFLKDTQHLEMFAAEQSAFERLAARADAGGGLNDTPLLVLTADHDTPDGWTALQHDLAGKSSDSRHKTIPGSTHVSLATHSKHSASTVTEIVAFVAGLRSDQHQ